jgi:hypothetical protein
VVLEFARFLQRGLRIVELIVWVQCAGCHAVVPQKSVSSLVGSQ